MKNKKMLREKLMSLTCYTRYDPKTGDDLGVYDEIPAGIHSDEFEFSYGDILREEFGINFEDDGISIDLRKLYEKLQSDEIQDLLNGSKYSKVELNAGVEESSVDYAQIDGLREETEEDVANRLETKRKQSEEKQLAKEAKKKAVELRKIEKLKKDIEKYKGLV